MTLLTPPPVDVISLCLSIFMHACTLHSRIRSYALCVFFLFSFFLFTVCKLVLHFSRVALGRYFSKILIFGLGEWLSGLTVAAGVRI